MKIAIITGGETGEREISIKSAQNVSNLIDFAETETFIFPEEKEVFLNCAKNFDIAIPMIHGAGGEDGTLQSLLASIDIPYIFSGIETHKIGIDKTKTKETVSAIGITSPKETVGFPAFVKPRFGGSSVASKLCATQEEFDKLIKENPDIELIKEELVKGREFTVGIVEQNGKTFPLPVVEIIPKGAFFDFENKYNPEKLATEVCPAEIPEDLAKELQRQAVAVHTLLKAKHLSRSDFIVTPEKKIYFLEINTIPGMTDTSLIPKMLKQETIPLKELLLEWCKVI
jgi:D-alanine-D-alanine ligase